MSVSNVFILFVFKGLLYKLNTAYYRLFQSFEKIVKYFYFCLIYLTFIYIIDEQKVKIWKESAERVKKMRPASIGLFSIVYFYVLIIKQN